MRSGPGAARTILLFHIISARPSKQPLMVRTFLKVYMELGSYCTFVSARTSKRHHHLNGMVPKCHFISVRSTQHTVVIHSNITFHTLEPTRKCVLRKDLKQRRSTMTHEMKQKQRDAEKLQYSTKTTEMKQKKHDAEKLRRSTMTPEMSRRNTMPTGFVAKTKPMRPSPRSQKAKPRSFAKPAVLFSPRSQNTILTMQSRLGFAVKRHRRKLSKIFRAWL